MRNEDEIIEKLNELKSSIKYGEQRIKESKTWVACLQWILRY